MTLGELVIFVIPSRSAFEFSDISNKAVVYFIIETTMAVSHTMLVLAGFACLSVVATYKAPDLPGLYCAKNNICCDGRKDNCSHEIAGTLCYCDRFCDRGPEDDCCPDYQYVCKGVVTTQPPPAQVVTPSCVHEGKNYTTGQTRMENCNKCQCQRAAEPDTAFWKCEKSICLMDEDLVQNVNRVRRTWQATTYPKFWGRTLKDGIQYKLGTLPLQPQTKNMGSVTYEPGNLPPSFDARAQWPSFVSQVQDQGWCGSDWAVSLATVLADRFAIQSRGVLQDELSAQTLLSCNSRGQRACAGGHIDIAWQFSTKYGLVSMNCLPYDENPKPCPFPLSVNATQMPCGSGDRWSRVYRSGPPSKLSNEKDIMYEIKNWGPVQAIITVYQDLFHYRSGVYRHTGYGDTELRGLHSVRVVGWGDDGGQPYWLIANSWGPEWGEDGYVRVAREDPTTSLEFVVTTLADVAQHYN